MRLLNLARTLLNSSIHYFSSYILASEISIIQQNSTITAKQIHLRARVPF